MNNIKRPMPALSRVPILIHRKSISMAPPICEITDGLVFWIPWRDGGLLAGRPVHVAFRPLFSSGNPSYVTDSRMFSAFLTATCGSGT